MLVLHELSLGLWEGVVALPLALGALVSILDDVNIAFPLGSLDLFLELLVLQDLFIWHDQLHGSKRVVWVHTLMAELLTCRVGCLFGKSSLVLNSAIQNLLLLLNAELKLLGLTLHCSLFNLALFFLKFFDLFLNRRRLLRICLDLGLNLLLLLFYWIWKLGLNDQALNLLSRRSWRLLFERLWLFCGLRGSPLLVCFLFWWHGLVDRFWHFCRDWSRSSGRTFHLLLLWRLFAVRILRCCILLLAHILRWLGFISLWL